MAVLLITVALSGCNEEDSETSGDTDKVELVTYNLKTIKSGFYGEFKECTATIKNIAGRMLNKIEVKVHFYDSNNNLLKTKTYIVQDLANNYTEEIRVTYFFTEDYYENIDYVKFEFIAS